MAIRFGNSAVLETFGVSTANAAIPTTTGGSPAKAVRVVVEGQHAYIAIGDSSVTVTAGNGVLMLADSELIFDCSGLTHLAHIQKAASGDLKMTCVENL